MREALLGFVVGLTTGGLSVWSLWLITAFTAKAAVGLHVEPHLDRPTGWDREWDEIDDSEKGLGRFVPGGGWDEKAPKAIDSIPAPRQPEGELRAATFRVFFAFLLKAPILYAVARVAQSMGDVALHWCVGGVVLVYFLAVFYAARRTNRR